jgi:hypothetical protein
MKRIFLLSASLYLLLSACTSPPTSIDPPTGKSDTYEKDVPTPQASSIPSVDPLPEHVIGIRQVAGVGQFYNRLTDEEFVMRGVNYVYVPHGDSMSNLTLKVGVYNKERTRQDFQQLAAKGYNTVRVFIDHCSVGEGCIGDADNVGLNPAYVDNIADMLIAAEQAGLYIVFTSNDLPDQGGYAEQANEQSGSIFAGYRNSYYLTQGAITATRRYWRDLLTDLIALSAPTDRVLAWQLLNEQWMFIDQPPLSLSTGMVETPTGVYDMSDPDQKRQMVSEGLIHYIAEVKAEILEHDPSALVTMGFFAPEIVAPGWYVDTAPLLLDSDLDFFDFHAYSGFQSLRELVNAFGMEDYDAKPIVLGEYGAFRHIYPDLIPAARSITEWQAESCSYGFDGWLYWTYYPAAESVDDRTWGLVDESGYLLDMLAPLEHVDPCEQVPVFSSNLAYGKPVIASASLAEESPEFAVDENADSQWGAGRDAPQWIEVDLEDSYKITEVRLLVAQWPEGNTIHRIRGRSASGSFIELHTFTQPTAGGDWLIFAPDEPVDSIQVIRIDTLSSPSWVAWGEIQVYGEGP